MLRYYIPSQSIRESFRYNRKNNGKFRSRKIRNEKKGKPGSGDRRCRENVKGSARRTKKRNAEKGGSRKGERTTSKQCVKPFGPRRAKGEKRGVLARIAPRAPVWPERPTGEKSVSLGRGKSEGGPLRSLGGSERPASSNRKTASSARLTG